MSLIKGLKDISAMGYYHGYVLVFQATTCTNERCKVDTVGGIILTNDTIDMEYLYVTNLGRLKVFV